MKPRSDPFSRTALLAAAAIAFCVAATPSAHAGTYYWDPNGSGTPGFGTASGTWGTSTFWGTDPAGSGATANTTITTSDDVYFGTDTVGLAAGTVNGPTERGFRNMTFGSASGAILLSGGTLYLNTTTGSTITVNNTANTISTKFLNNGTLTKAGDGKLTLSATQDNSGYSGAIIVDQGTLALTAGNAQNSGLYKSSSITINDGGTIEVGVDNSLHGYNSTGVGKLTINAGGKMTTTTGVTAWIRGALELNGGELASHATTNSGYGTWTLGEDVTAIGAVTSTMSAKEMNWAQATTRTFTVSDAAGILNVTGTFARPSGFASGAFTGSLNKAGLGTMVLSGANSYTGTTAVTGGTLVLSGTSKTTGTVSVAAGAVLELKNATAFDNSVTLTGLGTVRINGTTSFGTAAAAINLSTGALIDVRANNFNGGASNNKNYTNNFASLNVESGATFGTSNVDVRMDALSGLGTIDASSSNLGGSFTFGVGNTDGSFGGKLRTTGTNKFNYTKTGTGTQTLSGASDYTSTMNVNAGVLAISGSGKLGASTSGLTMGGGQLNLGATSQSVGAVSVTAAYASGDTIRNGSITGASYAASNTTGNAIISANLLVNGSAGFTKSGAGSVTLKGANTYTGLTTVTEGKLSFGTGGSARSSSGFTVESGATLELDAVNVLVSGHAVAVDNSRVITVNGGTLLMTANSEARIGNVTLNNGATWTSNRGLTYYDILLANTTTGAATVSVTGNAASVMNGSGGIHLEGVQNFDVADVTSNANADLTVSMVLANRLFASPATGGIAKSGAGTMVLTNTNTYTGATNVNAGKLVIGSGGSLAATTVTVGGATATGTPTLGGIGTIGGATTIAAASGGAVGTHAPGIEGVSGGVGTQAFSSVLTYGNGSIFEWDLNAHSTSTGFDKVTVGGNVSVGTGTEFKINLGSSVFTAGDFTDAAFWKTPYGTQTWAMSDIFSKAFSSGAFASVTTVQDVSSFGSFTINGTSLTWTAVPEPTSALVGLLITAGLLRRRAVGSC